MSRSVDPADRNRTIALISLQGDQFPRSALYLAASKISIAALMTGGSREVMRKCAMISPNAIPDWPLLAQSRRSYANNGNAHSYVSENRAFNQLGNLWCPVGAVSQVPEHQTYSASLRRDNRVLRDRTTRPRRACRIARWPRDRSVRVERRHLQAPMQSRMRRLPAATDRLDVDRRQSSIVFHPTIRD